MSNTSNKIERKLATTAIHALKQTRLAEPLNALHQNSLESIKRKLAYEFKKRLDEDRKAAYLQEITEKVRLIACGAFCENVPVKEFIGRRSLQELADFAIAIQVYFHLSVPSTITTHSIQATADFIFKELNIFID